MPVINMDAIRTTATTIFIFWGVPADVSHSEVVWTPAASGGGDATTSGRLSAATNSFEITDLRSSTSYLISLTIFNPAGHSSTNLTQSTTAGEMYGDRFNLHLSSIPYRLVVQGLSLAVVCPQPLLVELW